MPLKALAWEDEQGKTWLTYNDTNWIAERHGLSKESDPVIKTIADGVASIAPSMLPLHKNSVTEVSLSHAWHIVERIRCFLHLQ